MKISTIPFNTVDKTVFAFTTQRGDIKNANAPYEGFNVCDYTGDSIANIFECRYELVGELGIPINNLLMPLQTHSSNVAVVDSEFFKNDLKMRATMLQDVDAIVCTERYVAIGVNTADCVPIVFRDSKKRIIAIAHAGWRGTVAKIVEKTIAKMVELGCNLKDIEATTSISICMDCFEVGEEVVAEFVEAGFDMTKIAKTNPKSGKFHIDLARANAQIMERCGILHDNITISAECSKCNPKKYFSARHLGIKSGRSLTAIIQA